MNEPEELVDPLEYLKETVETYANRSRRGLSREEYLFRTPLRPAIKYPNMAALRSHLLDTLGLRDDPRFSRKRAYPCRYCKGTGVVTDSGGTHSECVWPGCDGGVLPEWGFTACFIEEQHKFRLEIRRWRAEVEFYRRLKQKLTKEERLYLRLGH